MGRMGRRVISAIAGKCPRCGRGKLFTGYLSVAKSCDSCALDFEGHDSGDGPAVLVIMLLGFVVAFSAVAVDFIYTPPFWVHVVVWPPVILIGALAVLRPLKGAFVGLQYKFRAVDEEFPPDAPGGT